MTDRIRLGIVGANVRANWAPRSHMPALLASPDFEITAVCTTRPETAEEARREYGAKLAFHDHRAMAASSAIDAIAVVVRVPWHYEPTEAALEAGRHVFTEWPLGRTTAEAEELAALARHKGVRTAVGLQARLSPPLVHMKELIDSGYIGEVMACHVCLMRDGVLERKSSRTWQRDGSLGANTLTIAHGHTIDALRFVVGDFSRVAAVVTTQARQWLETDTGKLLDVTSPDNVLVSGRLARGAVASVHVGTIPWAGSDYRMEIYGREGTLVAIGDESPQMANIRLLGARRGNTLEPLELPAHLRPVGEGALKGVALNVGQLYHAFAAAIRTGESRHPTFETAVATHRLVDTVKRASDTGQELPVA